MSRQQPPYGGPRGPWNPRANNPTSPTPSPFQYRPPSPWTPVAPSPPPIISGPRRLSMQSPAPGMMSPTPYSHAMSPGPNAGGMRGTRGSSNMPHPRPQWPQQLAGGGLQSYTPPMRGSNQSPAPYQPPAFQPTFYPNQTPPTPPALQPKIGPSPTPYGAANGPKPFRPMHAPLQHQNSYGAPTSSFQLSPTPSPIVCQTPNSEFMYSNQRQTPMSHIYEAQPQQQHQQRQYSLPQNSPSPSPFQQRHQQQQQPQYLRQPSQPQYDYVGVPLEPPQPKSYVIYDDEEEYGPSTAEIIANQSQDYIDEKLAEYQMTILQLQGECIQI